LGAKLSAREDRDFADLFAMPLQDAQQCLFAGEPPDLATFDDATATQYACDRQYAAYYAWKPFMHNPALARWLHRVTVPTHLIWGVSDGFVSPQYGERLAHLLPQSNLQVLDGAGHYPQLERTDEVVAILQQFDSQSASEGAS
jgi:pimeloyl-ACP methyl ester carboxylesterase